MGQFKFSLLRFWQRPLDTVLALNDFRTRLTIIISRLSDYSNARGSPVGVTGLSNPLIATLQDNSHLRFDFLQGEPKGYKVRETRHRRASSSMGFTLGASFIIILLITTLFII